jgi:hypothetical protein
MKKIKLTKTILEKKQKNHKKIKINKNNFEKKKKKKKTILEEKSKKKIKKGKKHARKVKAEFSTSSILKKNSKKIILKKNMWGNIVANKNHVKKHCNNPHCFKENNYEAKSTKSILKK